jgi:multidrug efflux pump subunit AcrB
MLYMKSTSGNDGSYTLTVSFSLGTDPDINTVNVNNRVQSALAQLPTEVQAQGLVVQKKSSAVLQFIVLYSKNGEQDPLFITNYAIINVLDAISRTPGVGQATLFAKLNYSMRIWFDTQRLTSLNLAPSDVIAAIRAQSVQAPVGRIGARPISDEQQFQFNVQTQGRLTTATQFGNIVLRANPDGSVLQIKDVARVEIGAQNMDSESRIDGNPGVPIGIYLAPGANAVTTAKAVQTTLAKLSERFHARAGLYRALRFHDVRLRHDQGSAEDAGRGLRAGGDRRVPVPRQSARHHHSGGGRACQLDRCLRGAACARLFSQHGIAARPGARHRHRRG